MEEKKLNMVKYAGLDTATKFSKTFEKMINSAATELMQNPLFSKNSDGTINNPFRDTVFADALKPIG